MKKILVFTGSRPPHDATEDQLYQLYQKTQEIVCSILDKYPSNDWYVVCGGANGVDITAFQVAKDLGYASFEVPAVWRHNGVYNRAAGYERNAFLVTIADAVEAIWDGSSRGTQHTMQLARDAGKLAGVTEYSTWI